LRHPCGSCPAQVDQILFQEQTKTHRDPGESDTDERHAIEKEKLLEMLAKRAKRMEAELIQDSKGDKTG
jgi:NAD(P)H-nitrite reductase large subunit